MKILAIIPARAGSKGVPGKNIRMFAGQELIVWSIKHAVQSQSISRVIVSTDSQDIADVALQAGAEVPCIRPADLAGDAATTESVILHTLDWLLEHEGYRPNAVVLLQPTSPLRRAYDIDRAYEQFLNEKADSLVSVAECHKFTWSDLNNPQANYEISARPRRQDILPGEGTYLENGAIYITSTKKLLRAQCRLTGKISLYIMPEWSSLEIDTIEDWVMMEALMNFKLDDL